MFSLSGKYLLALVLASPVLPQSDTSAGAGSAFVRHAPVPLPPWRQTGESSAGVVDDGDEDDLLGAESGEEEGEGPTVSATEVVKAAIPSYYKPGTDPEKSAPSFLDQVPIPFVVVATVSLLLLYVTAAAAVFVATNVTALLSLLRLSIYARVSVLRVFTAVVHVISLGCRTNSNDVRRPCQPPSSIL